MQKKSNVRLCSLRLLPNDFLMDWAVLTRSVKGGRGGTAGGMKDFGPGPKGTSDLETC